MAISDTDGTLTAFRREFIVRELSLIDGKTTYVKLLKAFMPEELDVAFEVFDIRMSKPYMHVAFSDATDLAVKTFFESVAVTAERKREFCAAVREIRNKRAVDFRIRALDASRHIIESTALTVLSFLLFGVLSIILFRYLAEGYFISVCLCLPPLVAAVAEVFYWYNVRKNKLYGALVTSAWQTLAVGFAAVVLYVAVRLVLRAVY